MPSVDALYQGPTAPSAGGVAVVPDTPFGRFSRGIYVGGGGTVVVEMADNSVLTFANANAGSILPVRATRVVAAGTTTTALVALF